MKKGTITYKISMFVMALLLVIIVPCASFAQEQGRSTDSRLNRLENELQTLSRAVFRNEQPPAPNFQTEQPWGSRNSFESVNSNADIEVRISKIEADLRTLTGKVEELNYRIEKLETVNNSVSRTPSNRDMFRNNSPDIFSGSDRQVISDFSGTGIINGDNLNNRERNYSYNEPESSSISDSGSLDAGSLGVLSRSGNGVVSSDPTSLYEDAFSLIRQKDYDSAERAFDKFLTSYPDHELSQNAMYWLGETHYVRDNYEQAAKIFASAYQKYPSGLKAPDNLLKMGMSLKGMGKTEDACIALGQIKKDFPNGAEPVLDRALREMNKIGCKN